MEWEKRFEISTILLNQKISTVYSNDLKIRIHYWGAKEKHYNNKPHQHSFFELCYIVNGDGTYIDNQITYPLKKGDLFLSRPYIKHQILSETGLDIIFIGFDIDGKETNQYYQEMFHVLHDIDEFFLRDASKSLVLNLWTSLLTLTNEKYIEIGDWI